IRYDHPLRAADKAALFKTVVKVVAQKHGLMATFMAKWNPSLPGCGGHIHQSLSDPEGKKSLFYDRNPDGQMSDLMRHYLAGQLALMREFAVMFCPTVNSYKRDRKSTRLNSSHGSISYAVFCLKKKTRMYASRISVHSDHSSHAAQSASGSVLARVRSLA